MELATNKSAYHNYEILETFEAGIVLNGDEVKSIRKKQLSLNDAFAVVQQGELMLLNCYIAPYSHAYSKKDTSRRSRVLLVRRSEINKLTGAISRKGLTLVPLKAYVNDRGFIKLLIGLAKHKKLIDKRAELKERDIKRETERAIKDKMR